MQRGFLYLVAIIHCATRKVLAWRLSNTLDAEPCVEALTDAVTRHAPPEIMNRERGNAIGRKNQANQGRQFTVRTWTTTLRHAGMRITMDGKGRFLDNILVESSDASSYTSASTCTPGVAAARSEAESVHGSTSTTEDAPTPFLPDRHLTPSTGNTEPRRNRISGPRL